jgi:hypothetical protein
MVALQLEEHASQRETLNQEKLEQLEKKTAGMEYAGNETAEEIEEYWKHNVTKLLQGLSPEQYADIFGTGHLICKHS